jgi:hypothetical protein
MTAQAFDEPPVTVTTPGVWVDMPDAVYHADPVPGGSLSSTGARRLLPPSCPAIFDWYRRNPEASKRTYDLGHAAHDTLLGGGPEIVVCDYPDWRTKVSQAEAKEARDRGAVPILTDDKTQIDAMVAAVRAHPFAGQLFEEGFGTPEASVFWTDDETGIWRRSRLDWLPHNHIGSRMILPDLKTCKSAQRDEFAKSAANYGYHAQGAYYVDAVRALGLADDVAFVFVAIEKTPPYLVNVIQLDVTAMRIGAALNRQAIHLFADCQRAGHWPSYSEDVQLASLPYWYERSHEDLIT